MGGARESARKTFRLRLHALLTVLALVLGCGSGLGTPSGSASGVTHPLVGAPAPAFELGAVGGGQQSLAAHSGKVVIVDFWATWCHPCKQSFPAYQALSQRLGAELAIVGISQDDDDKGIAAFVADTGAKFPVVWDDGKTVARAYDPP